MLFHRCAIPAWINQYRYLILKNQVSIPISISIFHISKIDTNFNINTPDLENQYKYQYQYLSFKNSITYNTNTNTENFIIQSQSRSQNQGIAILLSAKTFRYELFTENPTLPYKYRQFGVDKMPSHYIVYLRLGKLGLTICPKREYTKLVCAKKSNTKANRLAVFLEFCKNSRIWAK